MNQDAALHAEPWTDANSADHPPSCGQMNDVEALRAMQPGRTAILPAPKVMRAADVQALEAHVERREKLAAQIRLENPSRTEDEIEARLEQFGA